MLSKRAREAILELNAFRNVYTLKEAIDITTQHEVAVWLGVTDQAVDQMVVSGREIFIELGVTGNYLSSVELKPVGKDNVTRKNQKRAS